MAIIEKILDPIPLPLFAPARQLFDSTRLDPDGIRKRIADQFAEQELLRAIQPGWKVAITAGSRGICNIVVILREVVDQLKRRGAEPFLVACMGSHGGEAKGQKNILTHLGITEESMGVPVLSEDGVTAIGAAPDGRTVYADALAAKADALVIVNRVKPHTGFHAPVESGLQKMLAIGLGKQPGADACHNRGFDGMYENVRDFAAVIMGKINIPFAVGVIENAYGEVYDCVAMPGRDIVAVEPKLLDTARTLMPRLLFDELDVLIVSEMGKDISGAGMDTNVIGRFPTPHMSGGPSINKITILGLSEGSEGNGHGAGYGDFVSRRFFERFDMDLTYPNSLTNKVVSVAKLPPVMPSDRHAIQAAIKTCPNPDPDSIRAMWIKNTHYLDRIYISKALVPAAEKRADMELTGPAAALEFTASGDLYWK